MLCFGMHLCVVLAEAGLRSWQAPDARQHVCICLQAPTAAPFFGYLTFGLRIHSHQVGYPQKGGGMSLQVHLVVPGIVAITKSTQRLDCNYFLGGIFEQVIPKQEVHVSLWVEACEMKLLRYRAPLEESL